MDSESPPSARSPAPAPQEPAAPKRRGRLPGVPNKVTRDGRELIARRGKPLELLCDVARGVKIRVGPQAGPDKAAFVYPTLEQRLGAARVLAAKLVPDLRATELSGPGGSQVFEPKSDFELARELAFLLASAAAERRAAAGPADATEPQPARPTPPQAAPEPVAEVLDPEPEPAIPEYSVVDIGGRCAVVDSAGKTRTYAADKASAVALVESYFKGRAVFPAPTVDAHAWRGRPDQRPPSRPYTERK